MEINNIQRSILNIVFCELGISISEYSDKLMYVSILGIHESMSPNIFWSEKPKTYLDGLRNKIIIEVVKNRIMYSKGKYYDRRKELNLRGEFYLRTDGIHRA